MNCPSCNAEVFEIDVKCGSCGAALGATGAQRMIGNTILGQYELVDVLGQGGMSVVFKGRHTLTAQEVALKILPPELAAHSQVKSRFLEEAKALAALDHPNIVHLYNFGQENGSFVLAMQFVQGKTWERLILENKRLDWQTSCRITIDVLKALEYAHMRGVVHRDMKPSNVLVRAHDAMATVMDFGIAKMTTSTKLTATGQTMGTVRYMSPEQVRGQEVDLRTDIYSLGATLYESLTGDTPFDGTTHFEIMTKHLSEPPQRPSALGVVLPSQIDDAIMRCLAKRAEDRFESARDLRKILEAVMRENDVGLVETQRLNKEVLGDLRPTSPAAPDRPTTPERPAGLPRAATANDLAEALEPGSSALARRRRKRRVWPWLVGLLVVAGGATAALFTFGRGGSHGYKPLGALRGMKLTAGKRFPELKVTIETHGTVTPDEVAVAYKATLDELRAFQKDIGGDREVIDEIVAIPATSLCAARDAGSISNGYAPLKIPAPDCATAPALSLALADKKHYVVISDDRATLAATLRAGLAQAVCDFQSEYLGQTKEDLARMDKICGMAYAFMAGEK